MPWWETGSPVTIDDCAVQVTAGNAGTYAFSPCFAAKRSNPGIRPPSSERDKPTRLMTATRMVETPEQLGIPGARDQRNIGTCGAAGISLGMRLMKQWFYARNGQQSGPVSDAQLRELIRNGGLDPQKDLVWNSGMSDWQPAAGFTELMGEIAVADPANPYAAPVSSWSEPAQLTAGQTLEEIIPGSEPIDVGACVKRGFNLTVRNFGMILVVGIVYFACTFGLSIILAMVDAALGWGQGTQQTFESEGGTVIATSFQSQGSPFNMIVSQVFSLFLTMGALRIGLNIVSGQAFSVGMLFGEGRKLLKVVAATLLFWIMVAIGLVLLIVPGVYLALRYGQYMTAIVDRDMGIMESFYYSSAITTNNRLNLFLLSLIGIGIFLAGCLALVVGLIFAYPVVWLTWMVAYRWMQYGNRAAMDHHGTTTPMLANPPG